MCFFFICRDFSQWPLPTIESDSNTILNSYIESTENQINDLKKKLEPIQQIILSFRPKKKFSDDFYVPNFDYDDDDDDDDDINDNNDEIISTDETYENNNQGSLSEKLYEEFDKTSTGIYIYTKIYY